MLGERGRGDTDLVRRTAQVGDRAGASSRRLGEVQGELTVKSCELLGFIHEMDRQDAAESHQFQCSCNVGACRQTWSSRNAPDPATRPLQTRPPRRPRVPSFWTSPGVSA